MRVKLSLLVTTVCVGVLAMQGTAQAVPYAYASNQFTNLTLSLVDSTGQGPLPVADVNGDGFADGSIENVFASAKYAGYPDSTFQLSQSIPIYPTTAALDISQAFSGTGTAPTGFGPSGVGAFDGARGDSTIGAATSAPGAISISNVAEGTVTNGLANSVGNNTATLAYKIVLQTAAHVRLQFDYLVKLLVSTDQAGESANASISNSFSITGVGNPFSQDALLPGIANVNRGTVIPASASYTPAAGHIDFTSDLLGPGTYQISLSSGSAQNVTGVPEPASLALLGAGLVGLGLIRRRRRAS